jgi:uncharacterized repeat protein (TIGR02543 family)
MIKHFLKKTCILVTISMLSTTLFAQYGPQFDNRGFEQWTTRETESVSEPVHWHSGGTATGSWAFMVSSQIEQSSQTRPNSTGSKSVRLFPHSTLGVVANGNITNGRMNAGSTSVTGADNYNYTQRAQNAYNTPINQLPDSISIWVCFRCTSSTEQAQVKAIVHGDADYRIIANGTESPAEMHVATAAQSFTRTSTANGAYNWRRLSIPFNNSGPCTDVRYILMTATTNETPGQGSTSDDLFVDDVLLVYNPTLSMGQLASTSFSPGDAITIPFNLSGTMSPDNLNASPNQVIAQLSDANFSFSNPTVLGSVTTNTSGSITANIPTNLAEGQYQIRVISTNYPLIGQNMQSIVIAAPTYTVNVAANPSEGGSVMGGGTFSQGESCTVSATANAGYTFTNWTENGNVVSTDANYTFNVTANRNLVANFQIQSFNITATADPTAGGNVTGGGTFNYGQSCTLTATANAGYTFVNWTKNGTQVSTNASYTFTVTESAAYVAHFQINSYNIAVSADPTVGGNVSGGGTFNYGQSCTVSATVNEGYTFINWTENGAQVSANADYTFTVNGNRTLVAHFSTQGYVITAMADPEEGGTVSGSGGYDYGEVCTLTATANTGYTFVNWTKDNTEVSTEPTYSFTVSESATYVAHFTINSYEITATADPEEGGTVSGDGEYEYGAPCTLTATVNENYEFINWTKDNVEVSTETSITFTVTESATYVAHFRFYDNVDEDITASQIFPNPFTSMVSIKAEKTIMSVSVYDVYGRLVKEQSVADKTIDFDLSDLNDGTYLLQLNFGDSKGVQRIVKR